jgi:hypothetical protein
MVNMRNDTKIADVILVHANILHLNLDGLYDNPLDSIEQRTNFLNTEQIGYGNVRAKNNGRNDQHLTAKCNETPIGRT